MSDIGDIFAKAFTLGYETGRKYVLFPATEPAEEVKPDKFRKMTAKYATANFGFPDVTDPFTRWAYKDSDGDKWAWNGDQWELHIVPPSPAEPAEEETKAESHIEKSVRKGALAKLLEGVLEADDDGWHLPNGWFPTDLAEAIVYTPASSPVVPAPTEAGAS